MRHIFFLLFFCSQQLLAQYQEGDLLFQDCDCGAMCDAIESVTFGRNNARFSHIAIVVKDENEQLQALEANVNGVVMVFKILVVIVVPLVLPVIVPSNPS